MLITFTIVSQTPLMFVIDEKKYRSLARIRPYSQIRPPLKFKISVLWIFRCANPPTQNLMSSLHRNNIVVNSVTKIVDLAARVDCFVIKAIAFSFQWLNWYNRICRQLSQMRPPSKNQNFQFKRHGRICARLRYV